jgi:hypothetical protein
VNTLTHIVLYMENCLSIISRGSHHALQPLANIIIADLYIQPESVFIMYGNCSCDAVKLTAHYDGGVLIVTGMERFTRNGAFKEDPELYLT